MALDLIDEWKCVCGCGQDVRRAHDKNSRWEVVEDITCYAGAELKRWEKTQRNRADGGEDGVLPYLREVESDFATELEAWREERRRNRERRGRPVSPGSLANSGVRVRARGSVTPVGRGQDHQANDRESAADYQ